MKLDIGKRTKNLMWSRKIKCRHAGINYQTNDVMNVSESWINLLMTIAMKSIIGVATDHAQSSIEYSLRHNDDELATVSLSIARSSEK